MTLAGASAALASLSLAAVAWFGIQSLRKLRSTLDEVQQTVAELRSRIDPLAGEATSLVRTANSTIREVKGRITTVDPLLDSAHDVGDVIHQVAESFKQAMAEKSGGSRPGAAPRPSRSLPGEAVSIRIGGPSAAPGPRSR
ncbi:DUF948 domain-containing protein [Paenibacillus sp. FSL W8-1187]|uniref:DUF948 domain-containing protein n=1 Tax=Paenibacillus pasadenensis TaxID=217090 RepID=A0A2N5N2B8_9BACL|nr:DUF948 domain-containing protein [Paenibacillus pasadenensis]PLT44475.1 hypothetical protein B8V81_2906 [Paenibacillus pasadenensis]